MLNERLRIKGLEGLVPADFVELYVVIVAGLETRNSELERAMPALPSTADSIVRQPLIAGFDPVGLYAQSVIGPLPTRG